MRPRRTTSSPSSRKSAGAAGELERLGAVPGQLDQAACAGRVARDRPRWRAGRRCGARRRSTSDGRSAARASSRCAARSCARPPRRSARPRGGGRRRAAGRPQVLERRRLLRRGRRRGTGSSASSGVTQAPIDVANDLPRKGPSGWYSHAWRSRALQSLTSTTPKTCSSARRGAPARRARWASRSRGRARARCRVAPRGRRPACRRPAA